MATTRTPEDWARLGEWIAARRKHLGMDQRELAEAAGVSENTISNYERGRVPARGKIPAGYLRVEKALQFADGSIEAILGGYNPSFAVEGPVSERMSLLSPEEIENPLLAAVAMRIKEATEVSVGVTMFLDLAYRWKASEEKIEAFKEAFDELFGSLFAKGSGPVEVQRWHAAVEAGKVEPNLLAEKRPDLGWAALAVRPEEFEAPKTIGDQIREACLAKGIDQDDLSQMSKVPKRIISLILADRYDFPGAFMHAPVYIELLAAALDLEASPLLEMFEKDHAQHLKSSGD
ncbi:helix-turn-helix transcriptional regulator [Streptomyces sp. JS01]|uniref:helix-turn-helix domain-containing protein n=1 Tax=Streptomyces sp. JS01 TaxID=1525753 RepID=UPI0005165F89|nr:helix-turn-helix transcriptional regulator [Streptomyces sp. JS01]